MSRDIEASRLQPLEVLPKMSRTPYGQTIGPWSPRGVDIPRIHVISKR
jgi:hypothetical protein